MHEVSRYVIVACSVLVAVLAVNMTRGTDGEDLPATQVHEQPADAEANSALALIENLSTSVRLPGSEASLYGQESPNPHDFETALLRLEEHEAAPELEFGVTNDGPEMFETLRKQLVQTPDDRDALTRLSGMHARGIKRDEILALIQDLAQQHGVKNTALFETLGDLYIQQSAFASAIETYQKVISTTTQPMHIHTMLAYSLLKQGNFEHAIDVAKTQGGLAHAYISGQRSSAELLEKVDDEHVFVTCLFEAVARAKLGEPQKAKHALTSCGEGVVSEETQKHFQDLGDMNIDDLRDRDIDDIMD